MHAAVLRKEKTVIPLRTTPAHPAARREIPQSDYRRTRVPEWLLTAIAPVVGLAVFIALWAAVAKQGGRLPGPDVVFAAAVTIFTDPFYVKGPNDQGIGWNVLMSLKRVGIGFGMAALVGIPLGF